MENFGNSQFLVQGGADAGYELQEATPVAVYKNPLRSAAVGAPNVQHVPPAPIPPSILESTLGAAVPKLKTITVVHHKKVTPSSGLPISPQGERPAGTGQRKVISLLVSPIDSSVKSNDVKGDQGSSGKDLTTPEPGFPRPVNLVRRLGNSNVMPAALNEAMNRVAVSRTTTVTHGQPDGQPASRSLVTPPKQDIGGSPKSALVVKVSPTGKKILTTPMLPEKGVKSPSEYNRALLEYVNQTLAKSGRVTMIKDGDQLRDEILKSLKKIVVIDFFSMGSSECQRIAPEVQQLSLDYEDVVFLKVDVEHTQDTSLMYDVRSTPTFVILKGGIKMCQVENSARPVFDLEEKIKSIIKEEDDKICHKCNKVFHNPAWKRRHMLVVHSNASHPEDGEDVEQPICSSNYTHFKPFQCEICKKRFYSAMGVKQHKRIKHRINKTDKQPVVEAEKETEDHEIPQNSTVPAPLPLPSVPATATRQFLILPREGPQTNVEEPDVNYLDKTGRLMNKNWELDPTTGQMKDVGTPNQAVQQADSEFVKTVLKDWLVKKVDDTTTDTSANNAPKKVTLPFLIDDDEPGDPSLPGEHKDSESDFIDVETYDGVPTLDTNTSKSTGRFDSQSLSRGSGAANVKTAPPRKKPVRKQKLVTREEMDLKSILTESDSDDNDDVVVSPAAYSSPMIVSQEEPRDIEIAVPITSKTPTSSPYKRGANPPALSTLFNSQGGFWNSIRKDVDTEEEEDTADSMDYGGDDDDEDYRHDSGGLTEDSAQASSSRATKFDSLQASPSNQRSKNSASKDGHSDNSWLNKPNTLNPASVKTVKTNKKMVTKQVFETGVDTGTFMGEKPGSSAQYYFSISNRPPASSQEEMTPESLPLSSTEPKTGSFASRSTKPSTNTKHSKGDKLLVNTKSLQSNKLSQNSKSSQGNKPSLGTKSVQSSRTPQSTKSSQGRKSVENVRKRGNKRSNTTPPPSANGSTKRAKLVQESPTGTAQSDDNSDNCFVILSRDPKVEELLSAKETPPSSKGRKTVPESAHILLQRSSDAEEMVEDSAMSVDVGGWDSDTSADNEVNYSQLISDTGPYSCSICSKELSTRTTLRRHIRDVHGKNPDNPIFGATSPYIEHVTSATEPEVFRCHLCKRGFPTTLGLARHKSSEHSVWVNADQPASASKPKVSTKASTTTTTKPAVSPKPPPAPKPSPAPKPAPVPKPASVPVPTPVKETKKQSGSDLWTCVKCDKDFISSTGLLRHNTVVHPGDKETKLFAESVNPTDCWKCEKLFSSKKNLRRHVKTIHRIKDGRLPPKPVKPSKPQPQTNLKPTPSTSRGAQSESESGCSGTQKAFQCPGCKAIFSDRKSGYRHVQKVHRKKLGLLVVLQPVDKKNAYCWKCDRAFKNSHSLRMHVIILHKIKSGKLPPEVPPPEETSETTSRYSCNRCHMVYSSASALSKHVRNIHGKNSVAVAKSFQMNQKEKVKAQAVRSMEDSPSSSRYPCTKCPRVYSSSSSLCKHVRNIHGKKLATGAKSFQMKQKQKVKVVKAPAAQSMDDSTPKSRWLAICSKCGVTYSNAANLRRHQLNHYGKVLPPVLWPPTKSPVMKSPVVKLQLLKTPVQKSTSVKTPTSKTTTVKTTPTSVEKAKNKTPAKTTPKADEPCYTCKCGERFTNFAHMMKHIAVDHKRKTAEKMTDVASEPSSSDNEGETSEKEETEEATVEETEASEEEDQKDGVYYSCDKCNRQYASRTNLRRHQRVIHKMKSDLEKLGVSGTKCRRCGREFETESNMRKHFVLAHLKKDLIKKSPSQTHKQINARKPYCPKCGKMFAYFHNLKRHAAVIHKLTVSQLLVQQKLTGSSVHKKANTGLPRCSVCAKTFTKQVNLMRHFSIAHRNHKYSPAKSTTEMVPAKQEPPNLKESPSGNKVCCNKCGSTYSSLGNLTRHLKEAHKVDPTQALHQTKAMVSMPSPVKVQGRKVVCRLCVKFTLKIRELRRHLHVAHNLRLAGWDGQDLKGHLVELRTFMWKQLETTHGPKTCAVCLQSRLLLRCVNRHSAMPHSDGAHAPKAKYGSQPKGKLMEGLGKPRPFMSPSKKTSSSSQKSFSLSKSKSQALKGPKLFVKIRPIERPSTPRASSTSATKSAPSTPTVAPGTVNPTTEKKMEFSCSVCNQSFWLYHSLLRHQYALMPIKCNFCTKCGKGFRSCQGLSVHYAEGCQSLTEEDEADGNRYKCLVCKDSFSLLDTLIRHTKNQHRNAVHACKFCPAMFRTISYLRYHIKRKHARGSGEDQDGNQATESVVRPVGEAVANKAVRIKTELADEGSQSGTGASFAELAAVNADTILPVTASTSFAELGSGNDDTILPVTAIKTEPRDEFSAEPVSGGSRDDGGNDGVSGSVDTESSSQTVKSFIQIEDGRYQCKNCGSLFQNLKSLVQHQKIQHSLIRHRCTRCPAGFKTRVYLNYHCKRQHGISDPETERPVPKIGSATSATIKKSKKVKDYTPEPSSPPASPVDDADHRYTCPFCSVGFRTMFYLRYHLTALHGINDLDDQEYATAPRKSHNYVGGCFKNKDAEGGTSKGLSSRQGRKKSPVTFNSLKNLKFIKDNMPEGDHKCDICGSFFRYPKTLNEHKKKQHEETTCKCHVCQAPFKTESYLIYHIKAQHGIEMDETETLSKNEEMTPTECEVCGAKFKYTKSLKPHMLAQHRKIYHHCTECTAGFTTYLYLKMHLKNQHGIVNQGEPLPVEKEEDPNAEKQHICTICKSAFQYLYSVKQHIELQHDEANCKYRCSHCNAGFVSQNYYRHHMKNQHDVTIEIERKRPDSPEPGPDGRYTCPVCFGSFAHHRNLNQHHNQQHKGIRIRCKLCEAGFRRRCFLDHHLKKHHNITDVRNKQYYVNLSSAKLSVRDAETHGSSSKRTDESEAPFEDDMDTTMDTTANSSLDATGNSINTTFDISLDTTADTYQDTVLDKNMDTDVDTNLENVTDPALNTKQDINLDTTIDTSLDTAVDTNQDNEAETSMMDIDECPSDVELLSSLGAKTWESEVVGRDQVDANRGEYSRCVDSDAKSVEDMEGVSEDGAVNEDLTDDAGICEEQELLEAGHSEGEANEEHETSGKDDEEQDEDVNQSEDNDENVAVLDHRNENEADVDYNDENEADVDYNDENEAVLDHNDENVADMDNKDENEAYVVHNDENETDVVRNDENEADVDCNDENEADVVHKDENETDVDHNDENEAYVDYTDENEAVLDHKDEIEAVLDHSEENEADFEHHEENEADVEHSEENEADVEHCEENEADVEHSEENEADVEHSEENEADVEHSEENEADVEPSEENEADVEPSEENEADVEPSEENEADVEHSEENEADVEHIEENEDVEHSEENEGDVEPSEENDADVEPSEENEADVEPSEENEADVDPSEENEADVEPSEENEADGMHETNFMDYAE